MKNKLTKTGSYAEVKFFSYLFVQKVNPHHIMSLQKAQRLASVFSSTT